MRKVLVSLVLLFGFCSLGYSQGQPVFNRNYSFKSATQMPGATGISVTNLGVGYGKIQWDVFNGSLSACTVQLEGSVDSLNWNVIGSAQTCTSDGQTPTISLGTATSYLRVNVTAFTASSQNVSLNVAVQLWNDILGTSANPLYTNPVAGGTIPYAGTGSTVFTLSSTSGTVVTANTIYISQISCYYIGASTGATMNRTDTAGNQFEVGFTIPGNGSSNNSNYIRNYALPEKMVGLKMWSGTASAVNCTITATQ